MTPQHRRQAFGMPQQGRGKMMMSSVHDQFMSACVQRNEARFKELVNRVRLIGSKETINQTDAHGRTPLSHLCGHGSHRCVEDFARLKLVNVNLGDKEGNTPLHYAAQAGHAQVVEVLLDKFEGIEVDARNKLGITPLIKACITGKPKCVQLLLDKGADPKARDPRRGLTAAQWAHLCSWPACARVLEAHALVRDTDRSVDPAGVPNSMTVLHSTAAPNSVAVPISEPLTNSTTVTNSSPIPNSETLASNGHSSEPDPGVDPDSDRAGPWSKLLENCSPDDESAQTWLGPDFWAETVQDPWSVEDPVPDALSCDSEPAHDSEPANDTEPVHDSEPVHHPAQDSEPVRDSVPTNDSKPNHDSDPAHNLEPVHDSDPAHDLEPVPDPDSKPAHDSEPAHLSEPVHVSERAHEPEPAQDIESVPENGDCVQWRLLQWFSESDLTREPAWLRERHIALTGGAPASRRSSLPDQADIYRKVEPDTWRMEPEVPAIRVLEVEAPVDPVIVQYGDPVPPNQRAVQKNKMETLCLPGSGKGFAYE